MRRENEMLASYKSLQENKERLAKKELAKHNKIINEKVTFNKSLYDIKNSREMNRIERNRILENTRNEIFGTVLKAIYITALNENSLSDENLVLAEDLVDSWIKENGGASKILKPISEKTYLLNRIYNIVEDATADELESLDSDKDEKEVESSGNGSADLDGAINNAKSFIGNATKRDIKSYLNKLIDAIQKTDNGEEIDETDLDKAVASAKTFVDSADKDSVKKFMNTVLDTVQDKDYTVGGSNDDTSELDDNNGEADLSELDDKSNDDTSELDDNNGGNDTSELDDNNGEADLSELDDKSNDDTSELDDNKDPLNDFDDEEMDPDEDVSEDDDINDNLGKPIGDGKNSDITVDGDTENKGKVFDQLDKEDDVQKAVEIIKNRVADAEETFIRNNAEDKNKMTKLLDKISNNVQTVESLDKKKKKNNDKIESAQEAAMLNKRRYNQVQTNRPVTIFEKMTRNLGKSVMKNEDARAKYITESGSFDVDNLVESARVMYGFLETLNTLQLAKVDEKYIENVLNNMD